MIKYATINTQTNEVINTKMFDGTTLNFETFKSNFELANKLLQLIDISTSDFPNGQRWVQEFDGNGKEMYLTRDRNAQSLAVTKQNIIKQINLKTYYLKFNKQYSYNGHIYDQSENMQHKYALYSNMSNNASLYPLELPQVDTGLYLTINNKAELDAFVNPLLGSSFVINRNANDLLISVNNYIKIEDLVKFKDNRN